MVNAGVGYTLIPGRMRGLFRSGIRLLPLQEAFRMEQELSLIHICTGVLPRTHGSAQFTRGETQALVTATLGTARDAQNIDELMGERTRCV